LVEKIEESIQKSFACAVTQQNMYFSNIMNMNMTVNVASTGPSTSQGTFVTSTGAISKKQIQETKVA
jgi:ribonuclease I